MGKQIAWAKKVDSARDTQNNTVWGIRFYILWILRGEYCNVRFFTERLVSI